MRPFPGAQARADEGGPRFPWLRVVTAFTLTLAMFAGLVWHLRATFEVENEIARAYIGSDELRDLMDELEQRHSMTALMLIATRDPAWQARHLAIEERLLAALDSALASGGEDYDPAVLTRARDAVSRMHEVEARAAALAAGGDAAGGLELLAGDQYARLQRTFADASETFVAEHVARLSGRLEASASAGRRAVALALVVLVASVLIWLTLIRQAVGWGRQLRDQAQAQRRLEAQLLRAQKMEAVGRLASGVAHEFGNLLTAIRGSAALARERLQTRHPARESLEHVEDAANQAERVVRGLLTFARNSATERRPVELGALIRRCTGWMGRVIPARVRSVTELPEEEVWVEADAAQIQQALMNLVMNACDAMPEGGTLVVRLTGPGDGNMARITVADTGTGMDEATLERAVEPFFTTKPEAAGTGLGLPIVHGVVTQHRGRMLLSSTPGEGTEVTLVLPVVPAPAVVEAPAEEPRRPVHGAGLVLLSEYHPYARDFMVSALESVGFEVQAAETEAALGAAIEGDPGRARLLVMACDHPDSSGVGCLAAARRAGYEGPAIVVAGNLCCMPEESSDGRVMWLSKPVKLREFTRLACKLAGRSECEVLAG